MRIRLSELKRIIRDAILNEINISNVQDICFTGGSSHVMRTCKIGEKSFFLKFGDKDLYPAGSLDPSLQVLVEFLAYQIYGLYKGVRIPKNIVLVYDEKTNNVGIATGAIKGQMAGQLRYAGDYKENMKKLAQQLSNGIYVDILLANRDVIGTGAGNVMIPQEEDGDTSAEPIRLDPGASLDFRARGERKGFSPRAGELKSMLDPTRGAGEVFQYADLKRAASTFRKVSWGTISTTIDTVSKKISDELAENGMNDIQAAWEAEMAKMVPILEKRYQVIMDNIGWIEETTQLFMRGQLRCNCLHLN